MEGENSSIEKGLLLVNKEESATTTPLLVFSTFIIVSASFTYGAAMGYTADTMSPIMTDLDLSLAQFSLFGSLMTFGGMIGAIFTARAAAAFGHKMTLWLADLLCITGWLAIALAKNIIWLDIGRFLVGIGVGLLSYVVPVYVAEITPKHVRGAFTFSNQFIVWLWFQQETGVTQPERNVILTGPQRTELAELKLKDLKVKNYLFASIDKTILKTIAKKDTSRDIWESMKTKYQGNLRVQSAQLQRLRRNFEVLEMKDGDTITTYFSRVMVVANDMRNLGEDMPDAKVVEKILRTLVEKFTYVVCAIKESKDIKTLSVDELQSSLLVHEQNLSKHADDGEEHALKIENSGRGRGGFARGRGGFRGGREGRGRSYTSFNKDEVECYKCHKKGHYKSECPEWEKEANYVEMEEDMLLMSHVNMIKEEEEHIWFLDSGCSNHMCGNKEWFIELDTNFRQNVKLGDDRRMVVEGRGNLRLEINGMTSIITSVYYVPGLKNNLFSVGQLQQKGLRIIIEDDICEIWHKQQRRMIMHSSMSTNKMFVVYAMVKGPKDKERAHNLPSTVENLDGEELLIDAGDEELISLSTVSIGDEERKEINDEQGESYGPESISRQGSVRGLESAVIIGPTPEATVNGPSQKEEIWPSRSSSRTGRRSKQTPVSMKDYGCDGMRAIIEEDGEDSEELIAMFIAEEDPEKFEEAIKHEKWRKAMEAIKHEIKSIEENNTWELVELPLGANVIGVKWVFKTKFNERGESYKFKARLVAKKFLPLRKIDLCEVLAPVPRWDTIRVLLALAAQKNWRIFQLDVKSLFSHGDLSEDVYVEQPKGFESSEEREKVYKLKKVLCGLRHSSRAKIEGYDIVPEAREIKVSIEASKQNSNIGIRGLFRKRYAHQLTIGIGLMLLQQSCGTAGIGSYGSTLFNLAGFPARIGMMVLSFIVVPKSLMGLILVDRWGRRPLLMTSALGLCLSCITLAIAFGVKDVPEIGKITPIFCFIGILSFTMMFAFGMGALPWIIMSEIFPMDIKVLAGSLVTIANWFFGWIANYCFNFMLVWSPTGTFIISAIVCGLTIVFTWWLVPETRGLTLEEIQLSFANV